MTVHDIARAQAINWAQDLIKAPFVIFDTETTGIGTQDEICQIGIISGWSGEVLMNTLVKPTIPMGAIASGINGITDELLQDAPTFVELYPHIWGCMSGMIGVAYNFEFDDRILRQTCNKYSLTVPPFRRGDCAMKQYAKHAGEWDSYHRSYRWIKLVEACVSHGIQIVDAHDATGDCFMTMKLIWEMAKP